MKVPVSRSTPAALPHLVPALVAACFLAVALPSQGQTSSYVLARVGVNGLSPGVGDEHELHGSTAAPITTTAHIESYPVPYIGHIGGGSALAQPGHVHVQDDLISYANHGYSGLLGDSIHTTEQAIFTDTLQVLNATTLTPIHTGVLHGRALLSGVFSAPTYSSIYGSAGAYGSVIASVMTSGYSSSSFTAGAGYCQSTWTPDCHGSSSGFGAPIEISFDAAIDNSGSTSIELYLTAFTTAGGYPGRDYQAHGLSSFTLASNGISGVTDAGGHAVTNFVIRSSSGFNYTPAVPEPGSAGLLAAGMLGLAIFGRRRLASD